VSEDDDAVRALLAYLGTAMVATGQPVSDVEDELAEVSAVLGYPDVQVAASPTGVMLNLASGAPRRSSRSRVDCVSTRPPRSGRSVIG
jgi:uncharacterized membrane protein YjjP (DUF1212 family)